MGARKRPCHAAPASREKATRVGHSPRTSVKPPKRRRAWILACAGGAALLLLLVVGGWSRSKSASMYTFTIDTRAQGTTGESTVFVLPDFLPAELAAAWQAAAKQAWDEERWVYTTNNNGTLGGMKNAKVRGSHDIDGRRATAHRQRRMGQFAYSKWELKLGDELTLEVQKAMDLPELRARVEALVGAQGLQEVSDVFVTRYTADDFLSCHSDSHSGTWAFIVALTDGPEWRPEHGGSLRFLCPGISQQREAHARAGSADGIWCNPVAPAFNTAVIFRTRPATGGYGPAHEVAPLSEAADADGFARYALTGWYNEAADAWTSDSLLERKRMRGN